MRRILRWLHGTSAMVPGVVWRNDTAHEWTPLVIAASVGPIPWAWLMRYDEDVAMHLLPARVALGEVSAFNHLSLMASRCPAINTKVIWDLHSLFHHGDRDAALVLLDEALARGVI